LLYYYFIRELPSSHDYPQHRGRTVRRPRHLTGKDPGRCS
jgi:hypothetical protein